MMMTKEYTRTLVQYGPNAQRALTDVIAEYEETCDLFDVSPQEISIHVHMVADAENSMTFEATCHLLGLEAN